MKDDLPKAYTAYQQALYHLPNPKVRVIPRELSGPADLARSQSFGTASVSYMTVTAHLSTRKRPSPVFSRWTQVSCRAVTYKGCH